MCIRDRGIVRVKGDTLEIFPGDQGNAIRVRDCGDEIEEITGFHPISGEIFKSGDIFIISPATHFLAANEWIERALVTIEEEMKERVIYFKKQGKLLEAQRIESRTKYDMEMIAELGFCSGIENYSRHILGKQPGDTPNTLLDFFPEDFLAVIDESHISMPPVSYTHLP